MLTLVEQKKPWNLRVYSSVASSFDKLVTSEHRDDKGTAVTAACLMFLNAQPELRRAYVRLVKQAEADGYLGSVLDAAKAAIDAGDLEQMAGHDPPAEQIRRTG